ncbi:hypothetical protein [Thioclava kandeliae]|uniref:Uncharacterized protein n=1 Tax=Thioclava kandeliae TaxID=3070818 RepID=A0ABV1SFE4_9RHOB
MTREQMHRLANQADDHGETADAVASPALGRTGPATKAAVAEAFVIRRLRAAHAQNGASF